MDYASLCSLYASLESTSKRLEKTRILADALRGADASDLPRLVHLVQGTVFPPWSDQKVGVAERIVIKAMTLSFGEPADKIEDQWRKSGDLGVVAEDLAGKKRQATLFSSKLSVRKVFDNIERLSTLVGQGTVDRKVQLMAEILTSSSAQEAKYAVRTFLGQLRAGLGEGTVRDAIVWAFLFPQIPYDPRENDLALNEKAREEYNVIVGKVQQAFDIVTDFAEVAVLAKESGIEGLERVELRPGRPVRVMLFQKARDVDDAFEWVGRPAFFEYKYDGFRVQIHKLGGSIKIFTRRLEDVTSQFPDVVARVAEHISQESFILDGEAIGLDLAQKRYLPFQRISQRIKRKHGIAEMASRFPVELRVFDILFLDGKSMIGEPYQARRSAIERIVPNLPLRIAPAVVITADDAAVASSFYKQALAEGMEGVMAKKLDAPYQPGSRVGFGVKVKPVMDTLDLVVVRAEWGEGKRAGWLTSFTLACRDDGGSSDGNFLEIGNVGTGFKEKEESKTAQEDGIVSGVTFEDMTALLKPLVLKQVGREVIVSPVVVLEVKFEEIQRSPTYSSGFALRFPRLVQVRDDKPAEECSALSQVRAQFGMQR